ncbi:MAG TPA: DUF1684 domain-containing protein [Chitinophagales bacterium]|nr:DUF1684 domain-containing protein [Chitinophagales bacterium]HMZ87942.1 DUF1684 domain-containing protein [Chitinophagales bacterium]HNA56742.1 DUF1684 domain-containing protein [Chitinophagales bacterium]HNE44749.1 DUF1684 domain-containing protein [Chitinophagales bacterium]HNF68595.1 DUF1684 domain-containing protein [Chitinophagales bacterium]
MGSRFYFSLMGCVLILFASSCRQKQTTLPDPHLSYAQVIQKQRNDQQAYFAGEGSPLSDSARANFKGLQFYPIDSSYRVSGNFSPIANGPIFTMQATGDVADIYQIAGNIQFKLKDTICMLEVYRNVTYYQVEHKESYFVPFYDKTNGQETYEGGRYLDVHKLQPGAMQLDFNLAYQPYCFYSHNYSCPIPPRVNSLPVYVRAGERK